MVPWKAASNTIKKNDRCCNDSSVPSCKAGPTKLENYLMWVIRQKGSHLSLCYSHSQFQTEKNNNNKKNHTPHLLAFAIFACGLKLTAIASSLFLFCILPEWLSGS